MKERWAHDKFRISREHNQTGCGNVWPPKLAWSTDKALPANHVIRTYLQPKLLAIDLQWLTDEYEIQLNKAVADLISVNAHLVLCTPGDEFGAKCPAC